MKKINYFDHIEEKYYTDKTIIKKKKKNPLHSNNDLIKSNKFSYILFFSEFSKLTMMG